MKKEIRTHRKQDDKHFEGLEKETSLVHDGVCGISCSTCDETSLSEKIKSSWDDIEELHDIDNGKWVMVDDLRNSIKRLKASMDNEVRKDMLHYKINKIFGDKLI